MFNTPAQKDISGRGRPIKSSVRRHIYTVRKIHPSWSPSDRVIERLLFFLLQIESPTGNLQRFFLSSLPVKLSLPDRSTELIIHRCSNFYSGDYHFQLDKGLSPRFMTSWLDTEISIGEISWWKSRNKPLTSGIQFLHLLMCTCERSKFKEQKIFH